MEKKYIFFLHTLYPLSSPPNFPPAWSTHKTVSKADLPVVGWRPHGIPKIKIINKIEKMRSVLNENKNKNKNKKLNES